MTFRRGRLFAVALAAICLAPATAHAQGIPTPEQSDACVW